MRVCDYIAAELSKKGIKHVYGLMGGGAAGLNDGFIKNPDIQYIAFHHEQGAGHAAIGEAKRTGHFSVVNPTTGCGGTNCITSVLDAWQDGVPVVFISGNVGLNQCSTWINKLNGVNIRKYGIQEHNIIDTVKSITKYSKFITNVQEIAYELEKAIHIACDTNYSRPGPVWIDIPSDIQTAQMPEFPLTFSNFSTTEIESHTIDAIKKCIDMLTISDRPIVLAGQGIKQSNTVSQFVKFVDTFNVPFVTTYGARDLVEYSHPLNIGAIGIKGSRAGNFAMQASNLIIILGSSLNNSHIGYDYKTWTPLAKRIYIDNSNDELMKYKQTIQFELLINSNLNDFFKIAIGDKND